MESSENLAKLQRTILIGILNEYKTLKEKEIKRKKLQSLRNKRFYQKHRNEILKKNSEMRELYRLVKRK